MNIYYLSDNMACLAPTTGSMQTWEASSSSATVTWA